MKFPDSNKIKTVREWVKTAVIISAVSATISAYYMHQYDEKQSTKMNQAVEHAIKAVTPAPAPKE